MDTAKVLPFPTPDYAARLGPNPPLLLLLDADLASTDITVDIARRKITVRGAANAAREVERLLDELEHDE